jgi:tRNA(fMet)-specific endonuclease VapC
MVCAGTDFLIGLSSREEAAVEKLKDLRARGETVYTTTLSMGEYYAGAYRTKDRAAKAREFLKAFVPLTPDHDSARLWGQLSAEIGHSGGFFDLLIASIAISNRQALLTRDRKRFEGIPGLEVEGW